MCLTPCFCSGTVKAFYASSILMEGLSQFGEPSDEVCFCVGYAWCVSLVRYVRVTIKFPLDAPYIRPFPFQQYACTRTCNHRTPVPEYIVSMYARFVKRRISTRRWESFGMFAEPSTCYFCLSSVCVHGLLSPFQSVHSLRLVPSVSQDGLFRLRKAENLCLLSLQEELRGNSSLFNRREIIDVILLDTKSYAVPHEYGHR